MIDELICAVEEMVEARNELSRCQEACEYDAGYHCYRQRSAYEEAMTKVESALNAYIDGRVSEGLAAAGIKLPEPTP